MITRVGISLSWAFIQATLASDNGATDSNEDISLLRATIEAIRQGSPDDTHMAVRYTRFLEVLLDASLRTPDANWEANNGRVPPNMEPQLFFATTDLASTTYFLGSHFDLQGLVLDSGDGIESFARW